MVVERWPGRRGNHKCQLGGKQPTWRRSGEWHYNNVKEAAVGVLRSCLLAVCVE